VAVDRGKMAGCRSFLGHPGLRRPATRSDVHLLVDFEPGGTRAARPAAIETELSNLLDGRRVDLRTAQELSRYFRDEVVRTAQVQYAA
jgi:predicted nucleotidyltransferase